MKAVHYEKVDAHKKFGSRAYELATELGKTMASKYPTDSDAEHHTRLALHNQLAHILYGISGEVRGKRILDLGCGSNQPELEGGFLFRDSMYEPWVCRSLHTMGANPIGVDIGDLSQEEFEHYQLNLAEPDCLATIPDRSVDFANSWQLFSSSFLRTHTNIREADLRRNIYEQLERILKPEAIFLSWDNC